MKPKTLVPRVIEEVKKLKKNATPKEIQRLNFDRLDPNHTERCVYGLMSGCCRSSRAHELINKCAERLYRQHENFMEFSHGILNGKPQLSDNGKRNSRYSPLECFITFQDNRTNGNNQAIIDYLKGKTTKLKFKPFEK